MLITAEFEGCAIIPPASPAPLHASVITSLSDFAALAPEWGELFDRSRCDNVFLSFEWIRSWWKRWGNAARLLVITVRTNEGRLIAVAPFCVQNAAGLHLSRRILGFIGVGKGCCDHLDILVEAGFEAIASTEIVFQLRKHSTLWSHIELTDAATDSPRLRALIQSLVTSGMTLDAQPASVCPYTALPRSYPDFLSTLGKMRKNLRGYLRNLEKKGLVRLECNSTEDEIPSAYAELIRLHTLRFAAGGRKSSFLREDMQAFHLNVLSPLASSGLVRIYILRVGGQAVSALYGFAAGNRFFHYQAGLDPAWLRDGVGAVCIAGVIEDCISRGETEYDFLRGQEEYKSFWTHSARQDSTFVLFDRRVPATLEKIRTRIHQQIRGLRRGVQRRLVFARPVGQRFLCAEPKFANTQVGEPSTFGIVPCN